MDTNLAYKNWQDPCREELIGGKVVLMSPSPTWSHVAAAGNIYRIFANHLHRKKCVPIPDGFDLHLDEENIFIPDMMVVCDRSKIKNNGVYGAPDLVVEVLSPSTGKNDRGRKMEVYSRCGVREYWIVSTAEKTVERYLLQDGRLTLHEVHAVYQDWELEQLSEQERAAATAPFHCSLYDDLDISLDDIFDGLLPG